MFEKALVLVAFVLLASEQASACLGSSSRRKTEPKTKPKTEPKTKPKIVPVPKIVPMIVPEYSCSNVHWKWYGKRVDEGSKKYDCPPGKGLKKGGQCVALVKSSVICERPAPRTCLWKEGKQVLDNCDNIPSGTAIATFNAAGNYKAGGDGHAAIFLKCQKGGVRVIDQWCDKAIGQRIDYRTFAVIELGDGSNC